MVLPFHAETKRDHRYGNTYCKVFLEIMPQAYKKNFYSMSKAFPDTFIEIKLPSGFHLEFIDVLWKNCYKKAFFFAPVLVSRENHLINARYLTPLHACVWGLNLATSDH